MRAVSIAMVAAGALTLSGAPQAQPAAAAPAPQAAAAPPAADPQHGKAVSYTCLGCHGIEGYKNAYPMYSVPELRGQNAEYLVIALHGYRDGDRAHITMHSQTESLSEQDMRDVAAYLAGKPLVSSGKPEGTVPQAAQLCVSCHGQDGVAIAPIYPSLAGQHEDYIVRALEEYRHGGRKNPVMKGFAANLKDEDIAQIAAYFSKLTPSLGTEPRPYTRLGE
ncbi:MAG TPA: c-type cytochrome [Steroidobacteraceae bacterium]|nr:c-type cytochrome [Steroidobacteraceae bacterium]